MRCVFCAQQKQTGQKEGLSLAAILDATRTRLTDMAARRQGGMEKAPPPELAFYGGTFTALPDDELEMCLDFARAAIRGGLIASFRCSTRPDCVDAPVLARLAAAGCGTVELGVQSFETAALQLARRGYDGATAARACEAVRNAGMRLGVQLLPGMPGGTPPVFLEDVARALALGAAMLRFYPCLVLEGTGLAAMWRAGTFVPWKMDITVQALAQGWLMAHKKRVPVIRMGLAPEAELDSAILAGPVHPSLGDMVLGHALLRLVREAMEKAGLDSLGALEAPRHCQGYFWGHKGSLVAAWRALGLQKNNVRFVA